MGLLNSSVTAYLLLSAICYCREDPCQTVRCSKDFSCKVEQTSYDEEPYPSPKVMCVRMAKPGFCPKSTGIGICTATCSNDADCPGNRKCCGGCPRKCKHPLPAFMYI